MVNSASIVKKWSNLSNYPSKFFKGNVCKLLILLLPEVGIPSIHSGRAPRHGVEAPRDFESEHRLFATPLILKAVSLNLLKMPGKNLSSPF